MNLEQQQKRGEEIDSKHVQKSLEWDMSAQPGHFSQTEVPVSFPRWPFHFQHANRES